MQAGFDRASEGTGDEPHKTFSKEVSGKKVIDNLFHKVSIPSHDAAVVYAGRCVLDASKNYLNFHRHAHGIFLNYYFTLAIFVWHDRRRAS